MADTARLDALMESLERVRAGVCCYAGPTCDCKYGFPEGRQAGRTGSEQTGCPEIREAIGFLFQLRKLITIGDRLLTWQEWDDCTSVLTRTLPPDAAAEVEERLTQQTCACGFQTTRGDERTTKEQMRMHRLACTAVTSRG